jgi:biotin carboxyl carrier protein
MKYITTIGGQEFLVELVEDGQIVVNGKSYQVDFAEISEHQVYSLIMDGRSIEALVYPGDYDWQVVYDGKFYPARVEDEREHRLRLASGGEVRERGELQLKAPMPGLIVATPVEEGQQVEKGDVLIVLESMKMQNELKAPRAGVITRLRVSSGERVEQHTTLLTLT